MNDQTVVNFLDSLSDVLLTLTQADDADHTHLTYATADKVRASVNAVAHLGMALAGDRSDFYRACEALADASGACICSWDELNDIGEMTATIVGKYRS